MDTWIKEYDNDTGNNNESFYEWWNVTDGEKSFRCNSERDADYLLSQLTPLPVDLEDRGKETTKADVFENAIRDFDIEAALEYFDVKEFDKQFFRNQLSK